MRSKFYLNVRENGSVRATKTQVPLHTDEISIGMEVELPDTLFQKPVIDLPNEEVKSSLQITFETDDMVSPNVLDADVKENIENALSSVEGVKIELTISKEDA